MLEVMVQTAGSSSQSLISHLELVIGGSHLSCFVKSIQNMVE